MFKKTVQRGRSERRGEAYFVLYVEPLSDARTKLAGFFNILLIKGVRSQKVERPFFFHMSESGDVRAAICSIIPGLGHLFQGRYRQAAIAAVCTIALVGASHVLGRISGRAAEVFFFMILALPWWALQSYDAYLGPTADGSDWRRTFTTAWRRGHDIWFLGILLLISAVNDTFIILNNLEYLLPFYCTKPGGIPGFLTKAISPALHVAVGYGFVRLRRWAFLVYLVYAAYGFTNGIVNLACFGPGRIRNTLLAAVVISTIYIVWRRGVLLKR